MDFRPLYRPERHLFAIGYNLVHGRLDNACYDLMASECCLTSYLAVARGEAPRRHWFQLGRPFIRAAGRIGLISWGGTMFEYLMPRLLLRSLPGTLLAEACRTAVARQIEYGRSSGLPWGISESGFSAQYLDGDYQYQAFGVPGLGLKQGLEQDRVVAPYATLMATMLAPREALENFRRLTQEGAEGEYGFYEAIDYTPERLPKGKRSVVVRSYMAHHQGMSLVALTNALHADVMTHRFQAEPMVRAIDLLLEERVPTDAPIVETADARDADGHRARRRAADDRRRGRRRHADEPPADDRRSRPRRGPHILSNTQYHVLLTNAGSGSSTCRGLDVTRWREDAAREGYGQFGYVRDVTRRRGLVGRLPAGLPAPESYEVIFAADKATFRRRDLGIETIAGGDRLARAPRRDPPGHPDQPRRVTARAGADQLRRDRAGPARRRSRPPGVRQAVPRDRVAARPRGDPVPAPDALGHRAAALGRARLGRRPLDHGERAGRRHPVRDRPARFLGRGRTPANPAAMDAGAVLSGTVGPVLDPVVSLRRRLRIEPGGTAVMALTTAFAESRDEALALADQFREPAAASRAFELAWAHSQVEHRHHDRSGEDAHLYQRLASHIVFAGGVPAGRARRSWLATGWASPDSGGSASRATGRSCWSGSTTGDQLPLARQLLAAHAYLRAPRAGVRPGAARRGAGQLPRRAEPAAPGHRPSGRQPRAGRPARRRLRAQGRRR